MVPKGILIDFGDTLAHFDEEGYKRYEEALVSIIRKYGYLKSLDELSSVLGVTVGNSTKGELRSLEEFWTTILNKLGIPIRTDLIGNLEEVRHRYHKVLFKLYDGTISVLSGLKKNHKLALVSNCAIGLSDVLQALGLTSYFECIILSYRIGVRKPDRRIYLEALRCLKLKPDECLFVADEISDLEGARDVGLRTLLVHQGSHTIHEAKDANFKADFECDRISEITRFL